MKKVLIIVLALIALLAVGFAGYAYYVNSQRVILDNYPYEPDTPAPAPHDGTFVCDYGKMIFNGDGESITITVNDNFSELIGLPAGEYTGTYVFLTGQLPPHGSMPIRYDVAHEFEIDVEYNGETYTKVFDAGIAAEDGKTGSVGVNIVTPDRVPLLFKDDRGFFDAIFVKQ